MARKNKSLVRKKEILECFYQVIDQEGIENASFAKIAKLMDVNPSLLIHYFSNKEEMIIAMVDWLIERYQGDYMERLEAIEDPKDRLKFVIFGIFSKEWISLVDNNVFLLFIAKPIAMSKSETVFNTCMVYSKTFYWMNLSCVNPIN